MARSVWKGKSVGLVKDNIVIDRGAKILSQHVGQLFNVHNGQSYSEILIEDAMVGKCFGNFVMTRRMGVDIHVKKRKKGKK